MNQIIRTLHSVTTASLLLTSAASYGACYVDNECTKGSICQCNRNFNTANASCDELGGQCAVPVSEAEARYRAQAVTRAAATGAQMAGEASTSLVPIPTERKF